MVTFIRRRLRRIQQTSDPTSSRRARERKEVSDCAQRIWEFRRLLVELRRWQTNPESVATHGRRAGPHSRIRCDEPRFAAARIQVRRLNDLLRVDASDWHG